MSDGIADFAIHYCDNNGTSLSSWKILAKLTVAYFVLAGMCLTESRFRQRGIELEAKVEAIGCDPKGRLRLRYHFHDPATGEVRMNTVSMPSHLAPTGPTALIEYIPGEYPTSRLKAQARPEAFSVFFWVNVVFLISICGLIGYIIREANRPISRSSRRRNGKS